jgi:hypothetical protein
VIIGITNKTQNRLKNLDIKLVKGAIKGKVVLTLKNNKNINKINATPAEIRTEKRITEIYAEGISPIFVFNKSSITPEKVLLSTKGLA